MKKIHGVFSIQPLTLKDVTVADDAAIQEHKLLLYHNTDVLHETIVDHYAEFNAHVADNSDPHGGILYQSTIRPTYIECPPTTGAGMVTIRNTGTGPFTLYIQGDTVNTGLLTTNNLRVNGNTDMGGDLVVNGNFTVNGTSTTSNSTVTDYDVMMITPTTLTSPIGLTIRPDDEGQVPGTYTYNGDLVLIEKRIAGTNSTAFKIDYLGNTTINGTTLTLLNNTWTDGGTETVASIDQRAPRYTAKIPDGFRFMPWTGTVTDRSFVAFKTDGVTPVFYTNNGGDLYIEKRFKLGNSEWWYWDDGRSRVVIPENIEFTGNDQYFLNSPIHVQATSKTEWIVKNNNSSLAFYYDSEASPKTEFYQNAAYLNQADTYTYSIHVGANSYIEMPAYPGSGSTGLVDGVDLNTHIHSGAPGMGTRLPATSTYIASNPSGSLQADHIDVHEELVQDTVGGMVGVGSVQNGITVTYNDAGFATGKLNFDVHDPLLSLSGDVSGSSTMYNLGNTDISVTVHDDSHEHTNLDGTTSQTFNIGGAQPSCVGGVTLYNNAGTLEVRTGAPYSSFASLVCQNLTVQGTTTTVNSETMTINDNIVMLNNNAVGVPWENAGIEVERGDYTNATVLWNEGLDRWEVGLVGSTSAIVTEYTLNHPSPEIIEGIQDIVGGMAPGVTNGITVTYNDGTGKLDFDVHDFTVTLSGNVTGAATVVNQGSINIGTTVWDSDKVDGLHIHYGRNNEPDKVVRTDSNGYAQMGWINTTSGDMGTATMDRIYASNDSYVRYLTPLNFANQILALGSVRNAHTHYGNEILTYVADASRDLTMAQLLRWKNYGSGHVIFDASNSTAPNGAAVNNTNPQINWSPTYPTLMGWNGANTYGLRVDACRYADYATNAYNLIVGGSPVDSSWFVQKTSLAARPGVTRLYRRDSDSNYSVQTSWTGTLWKLEGYSGDTFHAGCHVAYADSAGNADTVDGLHAGNDAGNVAVNNTGLNTNLNADLLDGNHASAFAGAGHTHTISTLPFRAGASSFASPQTISFAAMPNTNYSVSITPTGDHAGNVGEVTVRNKTTTSFQVYRTGSSAGTFDWSLIGY